MDTISSFAKVLSKIDAKVKRMNDQVAEVKWFCDAGQMDEAYERALKLEETSEKAVLLTRALPAYTGKPSATQEVERMIALSLPVDIGFTVENWFSVRFPLLLPKKPAGSTDYIRSILYPSMRNFFQHKESVRYDDCVLIFRHVYDRARPERKKRDHDNIEVNMVADIVALYTMPDDSPQICSHYYCSVSGNQERTEVYVVPKTDFPTWLILEKAMPEEGVKLYEKQF